MIAFVIVIRLRNAPINFISSLRTRKFEPARDDMKLSNDSSKMTKNTYAESAEGQPRASGFSADSEGDMD